MKKIVLSATFALLALLSTVNFAFAEETGVNAGTNATVKTDDHKPKPGEIRKDLIEARNEFQQKKEALRDDLKEKRDEIRGKIEDHRKELKLKLREKIQKEFDLMVKRFNAAVERLEKIASRIDSRIAKLKSEGKDTAEAEKNVADAKAKIALAKTDIASIPMLTASILAKIDEASTTASTSPIVKKEVFKEIRDLTDKIKGELKDARNFLSKAIGNIKGLRAEIEVESNASSTTP